MEFCFISSLPVHLSVLLCASLALLRSVGRQNHLLQNPRGNAASPRDELITAIKEAKGLSYEILGEPTASEAQEPRGLRPRPGLGCPPSPVPWGHEASSAESGDSEIELVSEDPLAAEDALPSGYVTFAFGHVGGSRPPCASLAVDPVQPPEEREAELDSELIIESCDASSASEES